MEPHVDELEQQLNKLEDVYAAGFIMEADYHDRRNQILNLLKTIAGDKYLLTIKETLSNTPTLAPGPIPTTSPSASVTESKPSQPQPRSQQLQPQPQSQSQSQPQQPQPRPKLPVPERPFIPSSSFVYSVSLVVMPPPELWGPIVDIKKNHMNPRIKRPPYPHITLIQPFVDVPYFDVAKKDLSLFLQDVQPFHLNFSKFELFENRGSSTLFLNPIVTPANALNSLQKSLSVRYPEFKAAQTKPSKFEAHIGVGYFTNSTEARNLQKKYQTGWKPMAFNVQEIYVMHRKGQDTPFEVRRVIPLGGNTNKPHFNEKPI